MDIRYLLWLQDLREATGGMLDGCISLVTEMGMPTIGLILAAILYWCADKRLGVYILMSFHISCLVNSLLKAVFCVYRPWVRSAELRPVESALADATGYSFPSGHVANAASTYGALGYAQRKKRPALFWCMLALVLLIGFSRNYLGVHTPQDVLVSLLAGALILAGVEALSRFEAAAPGRDMWIAVIGLLFSAAVLAFVVFRPYPMDYDANGALLVDPAKMKKDAFMSVGAAVGFFAGWFMEKRLVRFETHVRARNRVCRAAAGVVILLLFSTLGKNLAVGLLGNDWGRLVMSVLTIFFLTGLYPLLFTRLESRVASGRANGIPGRG